MGIMKTVGECGWTHRLRSRTRNREHLLRLAQQFIAKLACGATKTSKEDLVRPSNLAVVDFAPWCTMWDKSSSLTRPDNGDGLLVVSIYAFLIRIDQQIFQT